MDRFEQITARLDGLGTDPQTGYTQKEIIDKLIELENGLLAGVYEKTHAENMRPQDLTKHFAALAEEFGLDKSETYRRFVSNMAELDRTVKSLIAGQKGERLTRSSLRPLALDKDIKILYNVQLGNDEMKTEYDAIVIAPFGLFVIEVKNWPGDVTLTRTGFLTRNGSSVSVNLEARMVVKETLLKECLGDLFPINYRGILLFPETNTRLKDEYYQIPFSYGPSIANNIRFCHNGQPAMTAEQVETIAARIEECKEAPSIRCAVKCDEIIKDYALLMSQMEAASYDDGDTDDDDNGVELSVSATLEIPPVFENGKKFLQNADWKKIGKFAAGALVTAASAFALGHFVGNRRK